MLVHAGRGIPALGRHAVEATGRHPGMRLILAHAGISDLAWIWREAPDHPNLFFDTSWWSPADVQALFALVPPGQILMASDAPYGSPAWAAVMATRNALQVGLDADQVRAVLGGQALRLANGEEPLDLGPAPGSERLSARPAARPRLLVPHERARPDVPGRRARRRRWRSCGSPATSATTPRRTPICRWVLELLDARERYSPEGDGRPARFAPGLHFLVAALGIVRTPDVPLPEFRGLPAG